MKYFKILLSVALVFTMCSAFSLKKKDKEKPVYAFGVSASFTDTVIYYTNVQLLDSVHLDKNGFLPQRETYSYQLKNYLEYQRNQPNRMCMIYFSENKKKLDKEFTNLITKYKKNKSISLELLTVDQFHFVKPEND